MVGQCVAAHPHPVPSVHSNVVSFLRNLISRMTRSDQHTGSDRNHQQTKRKSPSQGPTTPYHLCHTRGQDKRSLSRSHEYLSALRSTSCASVSRVVLYPQLGFLLNRRVPIYPHTLSVNEPLTRIGTPHPVRIIYDAIMRSITSPSRSFSRRTSMVVPRSAPSSKR